MKRLISCLILVSFLSEQFCLSAFGQVLPAFNPDQKPFSAPSLKYLSVNSANPYNYFNFLVENQSQSSNVPMSQVVSQDQKTEQIPLNPPLTKGERGGFELVNRDNLTSESRKLINFFFVGLTLPSSSLWVNLNPIEPNKITSKELSKTDLGRTLLEQDLQLKKDAAKFLHPQNPVGRQYWTALYSRIMESQGLQVSTSQVATSQATNEPRNTNHETRNPTDSSDSTQLSQLKKLKITTSNRVWITPGQAVILETEDGALILKSTLKVQLESDYLTEKNKAGSRDWGLGTSKNPEQNKIEPSPYNLAPENDIQLLSQQLMREIVLPALTKEVNEGQNYAPLRQVYRSLILAEWFKRKAGSRDWGLGTSKNPEQNKLEPSPYNLDPKNPYSSLINSGSTQGLESQYPWSKTKIWQDYVTSYTQGEYKIKDTILELKRMYFSGGMVLDLGKIDPATGSPPLVVLKPQDNPDLRKELSRDHSNEIPALVKTNPASGTNGSSPIAEIKVVGGPKENIGGVGGEKKAAASSSIGKLTRRDFLKLTGTATATALISVSWDAVAAIFDILGIPLALKNTDSQTDSRVKIVEEALKNLQPWELELLRRFEVSFKSSINVEGAEARGGHVFLNEERGFNISVILHEIGHVLYGLVPIFRKEWLANIVFLVEKLAYENYKDFYAGPDDEVTVTTDIANDKIKIAIGKDEYYDSLRDWVTQLKTVTTSAAGQPFSYRDVKEAYESSQSSDTLFVKKWYDLNKKADLRYERRIADDRYSAVYSADNPKRPQGFPTAYAQQAIWEELAEFFAFSHLNPGGFAEVVARDEIVKEKWQLLGELIQVLKAEVITKPLIKLKPKGERGGTDEPRNTNHETPSNPAASSAVENNNAASSSAASDPEMTRRGFLGAAGKAAAILAAEAALKGSGIAAESEPDKLIRKKALDEAMKFLKNMSLERMFGEPSLWAIVDRISGFDKGLSNHIESQVYRYRETQRLIFESYFNVPYDKVLVAEIIMALRGAHTRMDNQLSAENLKNILKVSAVPNKFLYEFLINEEMFQDMFELIFSEFKARIRNSHQTFFDFVGSPQVSGQADVFKFLAQLSIFTDFAKLAVEFPSLFAQLPGLLFASSETIIANASRIQIIFQALLEKPALADEFTEKLISFYSALGKSDPRRTNILRVVFGLNQSFFSPQVQAKLESLGAIRQVLINDYKFIPFDKLIKNRLLDTSVYFYQQEWFDWVIKGVFPRLGYKPIFVSPDKGRITFAKNIKGVNIRLTLILVGKAKDISTKSPSVVHRGHSFETPFTLKQLSGASTFFLAIGCRGLGFANEEGLPELFSGTRETGRGLVNNVIVPAYFETLAELSLKPGVQWRGFQPRFKENAGAMAKILKIGLPNLDDYMFYPDDFSLILQRLLKEGQPASSSLQSDELAEPAGLCLTPDSLISTTVSDAGLEYPNPHRHTQVIAKPLIELKPGDMVLSLNESTNKLEPHRVNALLDMGVKPVYRLRTKSGRELKTTLNHPYLTKSGWRKLKDIKVGEEITVTVDNNKSGLSFDSQGRKSYFSDADFTSGDYGQPFSEHADRIFSQEMQNSRISLFNSLGMYFNQDDPRIRADRKVKNIGEIAVKGQKDPVFSAAELDNFIVRKSLKSAFLDAVYFISRGPQGCYRSDKKTFIGKKLHLDGFLDKDIFVFDDADGVMDSGLDVFFGELGVAIRQDTLCGIAGLDKLKNKIYGDTRSLDAGLTKTDLRVNRDSFLQDIFRHFANLHLKIYHNILRMSNLIRDNEIVAAASLDAAPLQPASISWDQIVSIEPLGPRRVYDIEVAGTHNFVAQGIVAHNTYSGLSVPMSQGPSVATQEQKAEGSSRPSVFSDQQNQNFLLFERQAASSPARKHSSAEEISQQIIMILVVLESILNDDTGGSSRGEEMRVLGRIYQAMIRKGKEAPLSQLESKLDSPYWRPRLEAVRALGRIYPTMIREGKEVSLSQLERLEKRKGEFEYEVVRALDSVRQAQAEKRIMPEGSLNYRNWILAVRRVADWMLGLYQTLVRKIRVFLYFGQIKANGFDYVLRKSGSETLGAVCQMMIEEGKILDEHYARYLLWSKSNLSYPAPWKDPLWIKQYLSPASDAQEFIARYKLWSESKLPYEETLIKQYLAASDSQEFIASLRRQAENVINSGFDYDKEEELWLAYLGLKMNAINISYDEFKKRMEKIAAFDRKYPGYFKKLFTKTAGGPRIIELSSQGARLMDTSDVNPQVFKLNLEELLEIRQRVDSLSWMNEDFPQSKVFNLRNLYYLFKRQEAQAKGLIEEGERFRVEFPAERIMKQELLSNRKTFYKIVFSLARDRLGDGLIGGKCLFLMRDLIISDIMLDGGLLEEMRSTDPERQISAFKNFYEDYKNHLPDSLGLGVGKIKGLEKLFEDFSSQVYAEISKVRVVKQTTAGESYRLVEQGFPSVFRGRAGIIDCSFDMDGKGNAYTRAMHEDTLYLFVYKGKELKGYIGLMIAQDGSGNKVLAIDTINSPSLDGEELLTNLFKALNEFAAELGCIGIALPKDVGPSFNFDNEDTIPKMTVYKKARPIKLAPLHQESWGYFTRMFGKDFYNSIEEGKFVLLNLGRDAPASSSPVEPHSELNPIDPEALMSDAGRIFIEPNLIIAKREYLKKVVEAPLLEACEILYDKNIRTLGSSADKTDLEPLLRWRPAYAYIEVDYNTFSKENRQIADQLIKNGYDDIKIKMEDDKEEKTILILIPMTAKSTVGQISQRAVSIALVFSKQKMTWGSYTLEEIRDLFDENEKNIDYFVEVQHCYYDRQAQRFYLSQEHYTKANESMSSPLSAGDAYALDKGASSAIDGLCLTPDSLIHLADGTAKPLIELIPFSQFGNVKGDRVLSLNQQTWKLEPHRVVALLDMGVKPVYRLRTQSGKTLKTTLNHPYLVKVQGARCWVQGKSNKHITQHLAPCTSNWLKLKDIRVGDEIAVAGVNSYSLNLKKPYFSKIISLPLKSSGLVKMWSSLSKAKVMSSIYEGWMRILTIPKKSLGGNLEVLVKCLSWVKSIPLNSSLTNLATVSSEIPLGVENILYPFSFSQAVSSWGMFSSKTKRTLGLYWIKGNEFGAFDYLAGIVESGLYGFWGKLGIIAGNYLRDSYSAFQQIQDQIDRYACSFKDGVSAAYSRFRSNVISNFHFIPLKRKSTPISQVLSRLFFVSHAEIRKPPTFSVFKEPDILYDKIVSIEPLGPMQVYDIEVEGTHNFVAQGIVAHNTAVREQRTENRGQMAEGQIASSPVEVDKTHDVRHAEMQGNQQEGLIFSQIGRQAQVEGIQRNADEIIAEIKDSRGELQQVVLIPVEKIDISVLKSQIATLPDLGPSSKELILEMLSLLEKSPPENLPEFYTFFRPIDDLFGFSLPQDKLIALHTAFIHNPIAIFHEIGEYLIKTGVIQLEFKAKSSSLFLNKLLNKSGAYKIVKNAQWFEGELVIKDRGGNILKDSEGKEIGRMTLEDEALSIAQKGAQNPHYLLRALQRRAFKDSDRQLSQEIKEEQERERLSLKYSRQEQESLASESFPDFFTQESESYLMPYIKRYGHFHTKRLVYAVKGNYWFFTERGDSFLELLGPSIHSREDIERLKTHQLREILGYAVPSLIKVLKPLIHSVDDLHMFSDELEAIFSSVIHSQTRDLFSNFLGAISINSYLDLKKIGRKLIRLYKMINQYPDAITPALFKFIHSEEDLDEIVQELIELAETAGGDNARYLLLQYGFPALSALIKQKEDIKKIGQELIKIFPLVQGVEDATFASIKMMSPLINKYPSSWNNFFKPILYQQTQGAWLCLEAIKALFNSGAIQSEEDLVFLREFITKHGIRAYDLLENFLVSGVKDGIIPKPVSQEKELINNFLDEIPYPIVEIYSAYKDEPQKVDELKARCELLHKKIFQGDVREIDTDPLFGAMLMYVFPPAVTTQRDQYHNLYKQRPDRPQDIQAVPEFLQDKPIEVAAGRYTLKDPAKPLDESAWQTILKVVSEVNKEENIALTQEEITALGQELMENWRKTSLYQNREDLLKRLYRYFRHSRQQRLPDYLGAIENIMQHKQFIGDTLRDLINECISGYQKHNPEAYQKIIDKMFATRIANPKGAAQTISVMFKRFENQPQEQKKNLANILKIEDREVLDKVYNGLKDKTERKEISEFLESLTFEIQPGKEAITISHLLQGNDYRIMQSEVSAKYEFHVIQEKRKLKLFLSKRKAHGVAGLNMGVCTAADEELWNNPNFINLIIFDVNNIAQGGMHLLIIEEKKKGQKAKRYLALPGINPSISLLIQVNADDIYNQLIAYVTSPELARALDYQAVLIPTSATIHSNRSEIQRVITARNYTTITLDSIHPFSYSPKYSFQDCFLAAEIKQTDAKQAFASSAVEDSSTQDAGRMAPDGLCLTPDSLIHLADGTTKPLIELRPFSQFGNVKGDRVLSLDEQRGQLEPHRVNALLDMGVKPVYRITTASGKTLKTTLNHPYLVRSQDSVSRSAGQPVSGLNIKQVSRFTGQPVNRLIQKPENQPADPLTGSQAHQKPAHPLTGSPANPKPANPFTRSLAHQQWLKLKDIKIGDEIAVVQAHRLTAQRIQSGEMTALSGAQKTRADIRTDKDDISFLQKQARGKNNCVVGRKMVGKDEPIRFIKPFSTNFHNLQALVVKVAVEAFNNLAEVFQTKFFPLKMSVYGTDKFTDRNRSDANRISSFSEDGINNLRSFFLPVSFYQSAGIQKINHNLSLFLFPHFSDSLAQCSFDFSKASAHLSKGDNLFRKPGRGNIFIPRYYRDTFTLKLFNSYSFFSNCHYFYLFNQKYHNANRLSNSFSAENNIQDIELKPVAKNSIASTGSDLLWDKIVSIELLGPQQVYDIEVEGTHNFVAQGIVAHNTYQQGLNVPSRNVPTLSAGTSQAASQDQIPPFFPPPQRGETIMPIQLKNELPTNPSASSAVSAIKAIDFKGAPDEMFCDVRNDRLRFNPAALESSIQQAAVEAGKKHRIKLAGTIVGGSRYRGAAASQDVDIAVFPAESEKRRLDSPEIKQEVADSFLEVLKTSLQTRIKDTVSVEIQVSESGPISMDMTFSLSQVQAAKISFDIFTAASWQDELEQIADLVSADFDSIVLETSLRGYLAAERWFGDRQTWRKMSLAFAAAAGSEDFESLYNDPQRLERAELLRQDLQKARAQTLELIAQELRSPVAQFDAQEDIYYRESAERQKLYYALNQIIELISAAQISGTERAPTALRELVENKRIFFADNLETAFRVLPQDMILIERSLRWLFDSEGAYYKNLEDPQRQALEQFLAAQFLNKSVEIIMNSVLETGPPGRQVNIAALAYLTELRFLAGFPDFWENFEELIEEKNVSYLVEFYHQTLGSAPEGAQEMGQERFQQWLAGPQARGALVNFLERLGYDIKQLDFGEVRRLTEFLHSANKASSPENHSPGGIDLSQIELVMKNETYMSNLNPADLKILRAARALKEGWESLGLLYVHEVMLLMQDEIVQDFENKKLFSQLLARFSDRGLQITDQPGLFL